MSPNNPTRRRTRAYESVLQGALRLPRHLKEELVAALKAATFEEMAACGAGEPARCPRCGHAHVVRKGRDADGAQRWLCRGCGRTFTAKTARLLALSKPGAGTRGATAGGGPAARPRRRHPREGPGLARGDQLLLQMPRQPQRAL